MAEKLLEVKNLRTEFKRDKTWVTAVNNVSFSIQPGEILGLVGESGCGKSVTSLSIMKLLARNSKISNGEILLNGKDLLKEDKKGMRKIRGREVAMIFQEPMNSLNPCMRIEKQLTEAILLHNNFSKEEAHNRAFEVLKSVGIPEPDMTLKSYPHQLSGGMCQRVMIAMAMSCEPELLIADEPTTALDVTIQAQILELMEDIRAKKNTGILMITHDLGVVAGPGSIRGIKKCFINKGNMTDEEIIKYMYENQDKEFKRLNLNFKRIINRPLQLNDCQNIFCELDKYLRVAVPQLKSNRTKIKKKYKQKQDKIEYFYPPKWFK